MSRILVWLSGGVDSAVAAYLLLQQWHQVIAGFMKNYSEPDNPHCQTRQDRDMAIKVAEHLGIKQFCIFDFRKEYNERIIQYIYDGYKAGITPNPDVFCNNLIKFDLFLEQALDMGCDAIATGHYAIIKSDSQTVRQWNSQTYDLKLNTYNLYRGLDHSKDQSYFLSRLSQHQLQHAIFPLGELTKEEVRQIAHDIWLPNADRPDSQGLCFIGDVPMSEFLKKALPMKEGDILDTSWQKVGTHQGARFYTLGQRHQLFLPFKAYVIATDVQANTITVGDKEDEKLLADTIHVTDRHWLNDIYDTNTSFSCQVKVRYRQDPPVAASLSPGSDEKSKIIHTSEPQRSVTPGQILVAYQHDLVLGSGIIQKIA